MTQTGTYGDGDPSPKPEGEARDLLVEIQWLTDLSWRALEWGATMARQQMDLLKPESVPHEIRDNPDNHRPDPWFFPHSVRYYAKMLLRVEATRDGVDLVIKDLSNSGLEVRYKNYVVKLLHANQGDVPAPGSSQIKQQFYKWNAHVQGVLFGKRPEHVIILWDHTQSGNVSKVEVLKPLGGEKTKASVAYHERREVPHPALSHQPEPHEVAIEDEDGLDIRRPGDAAKGTG